MYHREPTTHIYLTYNTNMGSYCPICDEFVDNLDNCELPYGGAPAPCYDGEPSDRSAPDYDEYYDYDRWPARRPWINVPKSPPYQENLDALENTYYAPEIFFLAFSPSKTTRSSTLKFRAQKLRQSISPLLNLLPQTTGIENKLVIVDQVYALLKDNRTLLHKYNNLYNITISKLDEFTEKFPEAQYLKTVRYQLIKRGRRA